MRGVKLAPTTVRLFGALILTQAAHSVEEYLGRLWESFPPAAFVSGLVSTDREFGFVVANVALVAFGAWCALWPVRRNWPSASSFAWFWVIVETINGVGHPSWSFLQGRYTPGVVTAPLLFVLSVSLGYRLQAATSVPLEDSSRSGRTGS